MQDEDQGVNTEDDVKHGSPSPGTQAPDIEPHLNSFKNFGYQIASGMVRVMQLPTFCIDVSTTSKDITYVCTLTNYICN